MMKRVINFLLDIDKNMLAQKFVESDSVAIMLGIRREIIIEMLDEICKIKCDLKRPSHAIFAYKVQLAKNVEYRFDALSISALENGEVVVHNFHEVTTKTLLESMVAQEIDCPELVELLLLNILHTEIIINHIDDLYKTNKMDFSTRYYKNEITACRENETYEGMTWNDNSYLNSIILICDQLNSTYKLSKRK